MYDSPRLVIVRIGRTPTRLVQGFLEIAEMLISSKADVNVAGCDKVTPLHDAAMNGAWRHFYWTMTCRTAECHAGRHTTLRVPDNAVHKSVAVVDRFTTCWVGCHVRTTKTTEPSDPPTIASLPILQVTTVWWTFSSVPVPTSTRRRRKA
jgi:hypothetical protein